MKKVIIALLLLSACNSQSNDSWNLSRAIDWDSFVISKWWISKEIRLIWIDTPEIFSKSTDKPDCFAEEAKKFTVSTIKWKHLSILNDPKAWTQDKYNRELVYLYIEWDEIPLNEKLLIEGYAKLYRIDNFVEYARYAWIENKARSNKKGLWWACTN